MNFSCAPSLDPVDSERDIWMIKKCKLKIASKPKNCVSTSNIEPLCSDAAARLRGRPASAQVTSDPAPRKLCSSALNGPTYATYTTDTCTPPQLLHLFYD